MFFAEIDFTGIFTEKFLVAVGSTTGALAAFAIAASFWLVNHIVKTGANEQKISLVRQFMKLCASLLALSALSTVALAFNNRGKVADAGRKVVTAVAREQQAVEVASAAKVAAETSRQTAVAATAEKQGILAAVENLRGKAAHIEELNDRLAAALAEVRREPTLNPALKSKLAQPAFSSLPAAAPKLGPQFESVIKQFGPAAPGLKKP